MKAIHKKLQRVFVPREQLPKMRSANLALVLFFLDDSLLTYKDGTFYYRPDENYIIASSSAQNFSNKKIYNTLDFIVFVLFRKEKSAFYKATLYLSDFLRYCDTDKYALIQKFNLCYGVDFYTLRWDNEEIGTNKYYNLIDEHKNEDNKYLFAYFCKTCHYNRILIKDLLYKNLLTVDRDKNACFITYDNYYNKNEVIAAYRIATNPRYHYSSHQGVAEWVPFLYTPYERFETLHLFISLHDMLYFCSQAHETGLTSDSFACAFLPTASKDGVNWILEQYPAIELIEHPQATTA